MTSTGDLTSNVAPDLCRNNCGFFANRALDGYCSRCYADDRARQRSARVGQIERESPVSDSSASPTTMDANAATAKKARCPNCNKSMGILQYPCACGGHFCSKCRYSNEHRCPVDYKAAGRKLLAKANPQVVADRVPNRQ